MDTAAFGITCNAICPAWTDTPRKFLCLRQERELFYFMRELCENFLHIYKEDDIFNVKSSFDQYCSVISWGTFISCSTSGENAC